MILDRQSIRACVLLGVACAAPCFAQTSQPAPVVTTSQPVALVDTSPLRFYITYDPAITSSFTGRLYVMFTKSPREPRFGPDWFNPDPFFAVDIIDWKHDQPVEFDDFMQGFPRKLSSIPLAEYTVQAVMRRNLDSPTIGEGPGTAYSAPLKLTAGGAGGGLHNLYIDKVVGEKPLVESDRVKLVELKSKLLSDFFHRDIIMRAAVILPKDYDKDPNRKYPAMYWIGGFGSDHRTAGFMVRLWDRTGVGDRIVRVVLDPSCYSGHHVFADSDNNGPRGKALVEEFIPHLERTFRLVASPDARFVSGVSSGGWSSLWLQVAYPDFFGGVWSIAPDPIDFRDFQNINFYQPGVNMYKNEAGQPRPLARRGKNDVLILYEPFAKMDAVIGDGGQLRSFEWVFSKRGPNGKPEALYNRDTGDVNHDVAESWKRHDIRLIVEQNWETLKPKLDGGKKLHIFVGDQDTFYLDGAVKLFKQVCERLEGCNAVIEIQEGKDHGTIFSPQLRERIDRELLKVFETAHPEFAKPLTYD